MSLACTAETADPPADPLSQSPEKTGASFCAHAARRERGRRPRGSFGPVYRPSNGVSRKEASVFTKIKTIKLAVQAFNGQR